MRVISQDGTRDVPYEQIVFLRNGGDIGAFTVHGEPISGIFAQYTTPEKADKAMALLRAKYLKEKRDTLKRSQILYGEYYNPPKVFWFPAEEEL